MSSSRGRNPRSGDPRKRVGASVSPTRSGRAGGGDRRWAVVAALAVGAAVVLLALLAMRGDEPAPGGVAGGSPDVTADPDARTQAESACELTTRAGEAADAVEVDARSRYAAAVLLLDRAILDSARAAESDPGLVELDAALQEVHTAGHAGDHDRWEAALDAALTECRTALG